MKARILVVDDDGNNRELLSIMLGAEGYGVDAVASGEEALAWVSRQRPDLVLLDVMMTGMDGYQVLEELRRDARTEDLRVILLTAADEAVVSMRTRDIGAESLSKPVSRAELSSKVAASLARPPRPRRDAREVP